MKLGINGNRYIGPTKKGINTMHSLQSATSYQVLKRKVSTHQPFFLGLVYLAHIVDIRTYMQISQFGTIWEPPATSGHRGDNLSLRSTVPGLGRYVLATSLKTFTKIQTFKKIFISLLRVHISPYILHKFPIFSPYSYPIFFAFLSTPEIFCFQWFPLVGERLRATGNCTENVTWRRNGAV